MIFTQSMNEKTLIVEINKILKSNWSSKQLATGKWIEVKWEWAGFIGHAVNQYKECGWKVVKQMELGSQGKRRAWLVFINPKWKKEKDYPY